MSHHISIKVVRFLLINSIILSSKTFASFALNCQVLNVNDGEVNIVNVGDKVNLKALLEVPSQSIERKVTFSVKGYIRKGNLKIPYNLSSLGGSFPLSTGGAETVFEKTIEIPESFAGRQIMLQINANVAKVGKVKCVKKVSVNN